MASNSANGESTDSPPPDASPPAPRLESVPPTTNEPSTDETPNVTAADSKESVEESEQIATLQEEEMTPVVSNKRKTAKDPATRAQLASLALPVTEEETTASTTAVGDHLLGEIKEKNEMNGGSVSIFTYAKLCGVNSKLSNSYTLSSL